MKYAYRFLYFPARLYWFLMKPHVYGSGVIIERNGKVLLVRHTYGDRKVWHFPGGGRKKDESDIQTATREIKEELGLDISPRLLGSIEAIEEHRRVHSTCFYADTFDGDIKPDKKEIEQYMWWPKEKLPELNPVSEVWATKFLWT